MEYILMKEIFTFGVVRGTLVHYRNYLLFMKRIFVYQDAQND